MSQYLSIAVFGCVICIWLATSLQNRKLYRAFLAKYPSSAMRMMPSALSKDRHPEKTLFFFRRTSIPLLKADPDLWRQRQRLKMLLCLSVLAPILSFLSMLIYAVLSQST